MEKVRCTFSWPCFSVSFLFEQLVSCIHFISSEYAYGSHPYSYTGVYDMNPRRAEEITGQSVQFRESIPLGHTHLSKQEVRELVSSIGKEYSGSSYSILRRSTFRCT